MKKVTRKKMKRWKRKRTMAFELCVADAQNLHMYKHFKFINQNKVLQRRYWARSFTACVHELHAQFQVLLPFSKPIHFEHPTPLTCLSISVASSWMGIYPYSYVFYHREGYASLWLSQCRSLLDMSTFDSATLLHLYVYKL